MKSLLNKLILFVSCFFLVDSVFAQTVPPYCNNLVKLEGKKFMCGGELFYPIVVEYSFDVIHNVQFPIAATDYYLSRSRNYGTDFFHYESSSSANCRTEIKNDLTIIHQMGFNCIRTAGFAPVFDIVQKEIPWTTNGFNFQERGVFNITDFVQLCQWNTTTPAWEGFGYKVPIGFTDPGNYRAHYFEMVKEILEIANECSLKVILDVGGGELIDPANVSTYMDYLFLLGTFINSNNLSSDLKNTLMAYSTIEEPSGSMIGPAPTYTKKIICDVTEQFYSSLKAGDPNHLITIGVIPEPDIMLWDPGVMRFDFISPHIYPFPIPGNTNPLFEANDDMAVERVKSFIYWWKNICPYPWIIGETGFMAKPFNHYNSSLTVWGELENPIAGETYTQKNYASTLLKWVRDCGGSGFSWWEFQDVGWACFGLLKESGEAITSFSTLRKPVVAVFENYLDQNGQPPPAIPSDAIRPQLYYDMCNHAHFNPNTNYRHGIVEDEDTHEPIEDAYISATTLIHDFPNDGLLPDHDLYHSYQTFTYEDGSFTAIPYDYWEEPPQVPPAPQRNLLTDLNITASGSSRIQRGGNFWGINSGSIVDNDTYRIKRNTDKQISNLTVSTGNSSSFQSFNTLTTKNVTIESNASADFLARNEINIRTDFDAKSGSEVFIHLDDIFPDCNEYTSYLRVRNNNLTEHDQYERYDSKEIILNFNFKDLFSISPNPNNGIFDLRFESVTSVLKEIKVFNVFGELDYSVKNYGKVIQLNLSNLSKGVYFISVVSENKRSVKKIIIQ